MIIVCQKCAARLQVDELKTPAGSFTVRCPKCNNATDVGNQSPAVEQSAIDVGGSPSTQDPRLDQRSTPAPLFELEAVEGQPGPSAMEKLAELLTGLMSQPANAGAGVQSARSSWNPRRALVCAPEENRDLVARALAETSYQVFVAIDTKQAVDRMREHQLEVLILDPRFDPVEQGPVFVTREVSVLRPAQRRRLFFVLLSPSLRTMDTHAAFLNNVNAVVNFKDIEELPSLLEQRIRGYNELYKDFNNVTGVPAL